MTVSEKSTASEQIVQHLKVYSGRVICSFAGTPLEPSLAGLHHFSTLCYPFCGENHEMTFYEVPDFSELISGKYGILEPSPERHLKAVSADVVLCPGYGFTGSGKRLGKGGGYYDRWLSKETSASIVKVGVAFSCQILPDLPTEEHDAQMDYLVSEDGIVKCL